MRAQIAVLAAILVVGAGAASVESADCSDESFICAAGSPWYQASESKIRFSYDGNSDFAHWKFLFPEAGSVSIDFDTRAEGVAQTGKILLVGGRIMLTKGFSPGKGYEIDSLDLPILNYQLVITLLSQAFPPGPDKFEGKQTVSVAEQKRGIKIATTSASGRYPSPWTLKGEMERRDVETIDFSFTFSYERKDRNRSSVKPEKGSLQVIQISGEWKKAAKPSPLDPSMSLEGWSLYTLGGTSIKQQGATILDYTAAPQGTTLKTLGELQESIRKQRAKSKDRR